MRLAIGTVFGAVLVMGGMAQAQEVPVEVSKLAGQQISLHVHPFLNETDLKTLRLVATNKQALELFITAKGYAAIAVAPNEGFLPGGAPAPSAVAIGGLAGAAEAEAAALQGCEGKRQGGDPCVVVLEVGPAG